MRDFGFGVGLGGGAFGGDDLGAVGTDGFIGVSAGDEGAFIGFTFAGPGDDRYAGKGSDNEDENDVQRFHDDLLINFIGANNPWVKRLGSQDRRFL